MPSTTAKAVSRMRSRYGKLSGNAKAAASVTMPRIPHQDTTMPRSTVGTARRHMRGKQAVRDQGAQEGAIGHHPGDAGEDHDGEDRRRQSCNI